MKKIAFILCISLCITQLAFAADTRKVVAVYPFSGNEEVAKALQERISNELLRMNRVVLVNKKIFDTEDSRRAETFTTANEIGNYGKQMGASHVLKGTVVNAEIKDKSNEKKQLWEAKITLELAVVDVESGRILASFTFSDRSPKREESREKVLAEAYNTLTDRAIPFLKNSFPIEGRIVEVQEKVKEKDGQKIYDVDYLLVNVGVAEGIKKKMIFDVYQQVIRKDAGVEKILENHIGQIKIKEVKGEFSVATVHKNSEEMRAVLEDPKMFIIKTLPERVR